MSFGLNDTPAIDLLREQLARLIQLLRGGTLEYTHAKIPFCVLVPDFGVNQATLTQRHTTSIAELAEIVLLNQPLEIDLITGRASQTGNERNNLALSRARAQAVQDELRRLHVYPLPPIVGLGSSNPIQDIPGIESDLNRSVEINMWYDLSYHFDSQTGSTPGNDHPATFWRNYLPGSRYDRAAMVLQLVYDNIDTLYASDHGAGWAAIEDSLAVMDAVTIWQDDDLVRTRAVLGYYKQTGSDAAAISEDIAKFNQLLQDKGLSPHDFTGSEISDAEHFATAAIMTMIPILGLAIGPSFSLLWEGGQGAVGYVRTGSTGSFKYNLQQFIGADMAGAAYGMMRTHYLPFP